jgi:hypothetical protein
MVCATVALTLPVTMQNTADEAAIKEQEPKKARQPELGIEDALGALHRRVTGVVLDHVTKAEVTVFGFHGFHGFLGLHGGVTDQMETKQEYRLWKCYCLYCSCGNDKGSGDGIWEWDLGMGSGNGIWEWDLGMGFGNGILEWDLGMGSGNGIWEWDLGMGAEDGE